MASYKSFEDLPVWQVASRLDDEIDALIFAAPTRMTRSFRDQLGRAALSICNNISEGFERGTNNELLSFIYIARGSAGEVRSMLRAVVRRRYMAESEVDLERLIAMAESCSRQLWAWAEAIKRGSYPGARHFNYETGTELLKRPRAKPGK